MRQVNYKACFHNYKAGVTVMFLTITRPNIYKNYFFNLN